MAEEPIKFTHIGVKEETQKMIAILAQVANGGQRMRIYDLVDQMAREKWQEAKEAGVVTDAMLNPPAHWVGGSNPLAPKKKRATRAAREVQGA